MIFFFKNFIYIFLKRILRQIVSNSYEIFEKMSGKWEIIEKFLLNNSILLTFATHKKQYTFLNWFWVKAIL